MQPRLIGALFLAGTALGATSTVLSGCASYDHAASAAEVSDELSDTHVFASAVLGEAVNVRIAPPTSDSPGPWPTIYVLDGNYLFGLVTDTVRLLNLAGLLPACIVVGIDVAAGSGTSGNRADSPDVASEARGRHFTPTPSAVPVQATGLQGAGHAHGGADTFLAFLTDELPVFVGAQYPIDAHRRVLVGDGLAGLFVLHALFASAAFTHYLAVSPALWWDEGIAFREEEAFARRSDDRAVSLFLAVGERDDTSGTHDDAGALALVKNVDAMTSRLRGRAHPTLRSETVIFEGESQGSVTPAAVSRGLRFLLQTR